MGAIKNWVYARLRAAQQQRAARHIARLGYDRLFDKRPAEAFPCVAGDLWFLYRMVREHKPGVVLEFGSGCSTIMFAQALADNARDGAPGHLYSLDADPKWGQVTIDSMPDALNTWCDITLTTAEPHDYAGTPVWRFAGVPDVVPDLIYLDGPALTKERKAAVDVLDLEPALKPGTRLIVDGRVANCAFLEKHFQRQWTRRRNKLLKNRMYILVG